MPLTNLAGRTLPDLVTGRDTDLTRLPWVGHRSPRWEPEPLRWIGVNGGSWAVTGADVEEAAAKADRQQRANMRVPPEAAA